MGLRRLAKVAEEPQAPVGWGGPVRITPTGRIASGGGPTVQPGTPYDDPPVLDLGKIDVAKVQIDRRDLGVSMGTRVVVNKRNVVTVPSVPSIRKPIIAAPRPLPPQIVRLPPSHGTPKLPTLPPGLPKLPPQILNPPIIIPTRPKGVLDVIIDIIKPKSLRKENEVGLDLGALIGGLGGRYIDAKYGTAPPSFFTPGYTDVPTTPVLEPTPDGIIGGMLKDCNPNCLPPGYKFDKCGNVVKTRRRRRRRLATSSDIKDLAALSSVTSGPEKKTWIATHPS